MKHHFQAMVLEGISLDNDFLNWIPILESAKAGWDIFPEESPVRRLGPTCFGRVAIAAVEQYSRQKRLNGGTTERLRYGALNLFLSAATVQAFNDGVSDVLQGLAQHKPELNDWVCETWATAQRKYLEHWCLAAANAHRILSEIRDQNARRGKRGNPGRTGTHHLKSPDAEMLEAMDSAVLKMALERTEISKRSDISEVRAMIRPVVRDFIARGNFSYDSQSKSLTETVDQHARRVLRKYDAIVEQRT